MNDTEIIKILQNNGVGVLPTDTVYGIVGRLLSEEAARRIYEAKQRSTSKAVGTILIANVAQLEGIVDPEILAQAQKYWPGPTSVIVPVVGLGYAHVGLGSLPFRIPDFPELIALLEKTGPLATSSANIEGQLPAITSAQAREYFGEAVDFYVDGGDLSAHRPSRIIELLADGGEREIRN